MGLSGTVTANMTCWIWVSSAFSMDEVQQFQLNCWIISWIIPARGPMQCCKEHEPWRRDTRLDSVSSLCEDTVEDRVQDLFDRFSVEAAVQDPFVWLSVQGVYKTRSRKKISVRDLISVQALYRRSLSKISVLFTSSLYKISFLREYPQVYPLVI